MLKFLSHSIQCVEVFKRLVPVPLHHNLNRQCCLNTLYKRLNSIELTWHSLFYVCEYTVSSDLAEEGVRSHYRATMSFLGIEIWSSRKRFF